jgi:hypothetical protein
MANFTIVGPAAAFALRAPAPKEAGHYEVASAVLGI